MAYNSRLADKIREALMDQTHIEEKNMFGGICFLVNGKMCIGVVKDEMMCRINPELDDVVLEMHGCRAMDFTGKPMKGYVFVSEEGMRTKKEFTYWIDLCLQFNLIAKASKKVKKK